MAVSDWSTTAASNTTVGGVNVAENCPPGNINNAIREVMAQIRAWYADVPETADVQPKDATLTALAGVTTAADKLVYATGADTFATTDLTAFARTLLDDTTPAAARTTLGALGISAASLAPSGFVKFTNGFTIIWGSFTAGGNSHTTFNYSTISGSIALSTFSVALVSGVWSTTGGTQDNNPGVTSCGTTGFTVYSAGDSSAATFFIAVGA